MPHGLLWVKMTMTNNWSIGDLILLLLYHLIVMPEIKGYSNVIYNCIRDFGVALEILG